MALPMSTSSAPISMASATSQIMSPARVATMAAQDLMRLGTEQ
jgi:hypothetical protein